MTRARGSEIAARMLDMEPSTHFFKRLPLWCRVRSIVLGVVYLPVRLHHICAPGIEVITRLSTLRSRTTWAFLSWNMLPLVAGDLEILGEVCTASDRTEKPGLILLLFRLVI